MRKIIFFLSLILTAAPVLAQVTYWHETNGPEAGTVESIMIDSSGRVIVLTAGSGAFRSTDNGSSWSLLNTGLPKAQLYLGAVTAQGYIIAANSAADGQLFRYNENDPNAQWVDITPYKDTAGLIINDIIADPGGPIYLATGSHGVLRSDDNGNTWMVKGLLIDTTSVKPLLYDDNVFLLSIDGNGNLFAGLAAYGAVFRSTNKGDSWTRLPARCPDGLKTISTLLAAPNGNIIMGTHEQTLTTGGHIFVSTDTAKTWKAVYQRPANTDEQKNNIDRFIRVPNTNVIYANAHGPTLRSIDDGVTWVIQDTNKRGDEVFAMAAKDTNLFQMCEPDGIFLSNDNGSTWTPKNKGVYAAYMWGVAINSKQNIFAITEYGLWGSTDNGDSWDHKPEYGEDYNPSIFIDSKDSIFIGTNKGLFRSGDDGQTLKRVIIHLDDSVYGNDSLIHNVINQVGEDGHGKIFCASNIDSIGFRYSTNEGDSWTQIPRFPQQPQFQEVLAFGFASSDTILATVGTFGTSSFYRSIDDGATWGLLNNNSTILASQVLIHPQGFYLARVGTGDGGGIFLSNDGAKTWARIFPPLDQNTVFRVYYYMMIDLTGNIIVCTDSGVYRSKDGSFSQWYSISGGLTANDVPNHYVSCVGVVENPISHVYFAASHGLGVFKSIPNLGVSNTLPIAPTFVSAYPNPFQKTTTISFDLLKRENVTLAVYDMLGREVQSLVQGTFDQGRHTEVLDGSLLPSGNYMIMLRSGDGNYSSWVTLQK